MKEVKQIIEAFEKVDFGQRKAALATVVGVAGSAYRRPGARMLITDDGRWTGAISGGCLEGDALRKAKAVMMNQKPEVITYDTMDDTSDASIAVGLGCNGVVDILIEPIDNQSHASTIKLLKAFLNSGEVAVLGTVIAVAGSSSSLPVAAKVLLDSKGDFHLSGVEQSCISIFTADAHAALRSMKPSQHEYTFEGCEVVVTYEILKPGLQLVIFGGGYDAAPVVTIGNQLGWEVTVTDDCVAHLGAKRFPGACQVLMAPRDSISETITFKRNAAAVLMSHNFDYDCAALKELIKTSVNYIGIVGPKKRFEKMAAKLEGQGIALSKEDHKRIFAPVGLNIGAETPDEIAVSIISEIQAFFSHKQGGHLRDLTVPIHHEFSQSIAGMALNG